MQEIELKLTVDEVNIILEGLGNMPFKTVFGLIGKIQNQAAAQLQATTPTNNTPDSLSIAPDDASNP